MDLGLTGRAAIVTGGSEGIDRGLVACLAREGFCVAVATRNPEPGQEATDLAGREAGEAILSEMAGRGRGSIMQITSNSGLQEQAASTVATSREGKLFNVKSQCNGRPEGMGHPACFLVSGLSSSITAQTISVGGGARMP